MAQQRVRKLELFFICGKIVTEDDWKGVRCYIFYYNLDVDIYASLIFYIFFTIKRLASAYYTKCIFKCEARLKEWRRIFIRILIELNYDEMRLMCVWVVMRAIKGGN